MLNRWYVYLLRCSDGTLYCGVSNDIEKRCRIHNSGKGAKYTRSRLPVKVVYKEEVTDKSAALKREYVIKQMTKIQKEKLVSDRSL